MSFHISRGLRFGLYGIAVFILGASMYSLAKPSVSGDIPSVSPEDHIRGSVDAPITIVEYSDFQCPACATFEPVVQGILAANSDNVQVVYRHFPLYTLHPNAEAAAIASEAAGQQGKFWEMHDMLFDRQADWEDLAAPAPIFTAYAELLELNTEQFTADLNNKDLRDRVKVDVTSGNAAHISATPTFYINGEVVVFPKTESPFTYLQSRIDAILAATPAE